MNLYMKRITAITVMAALLLGFAGGISIPKANAASSENGAA